ncbi:unnamed protein product [Phaeothamnion confervicola]
MAENFTPEQQEALIRQMQQETQQRAVQELAQSLTVKCFKKCIKTRGERLDTGEQECLAMCMDRYIDTMGIVNKAVVDRSQMR